MKMRNFCMGKNTNVLMKQQARNEWATFFVNNYTCYKRLISKLYKNLKASFIMKTSKPGISGA